MNARSPAADAPQYNAALSVDQNVQRAYSALQQAFERIRVLEQDEVVIADVRRDQTWEHTSAMPDTHGINKDHDRRYVRLGSTLVAHGFAISVFDSDEVLAVGDGTAGFVVPEDLDGYNITRIIAAVYTKGVGSGSTNVVVRRRREGVDGDVTDTPVVLLDQYWSDTCTLSEYKSLAKGDVLYVDVDAVHGTTPPYGLTVTASIVK